MPSLPPCICPCENVRRSCRWVVRNNDVVKIQAAKVRSLAESLAVECGEKATEWDAEGWHYNGGSFRGDESTRKERVALYILALDAINFCFWPHPTKRESNDLEYDHLAVALRKLAEKDDEVDSAENTYFFNPGSLSVLTLHDMKHSLEPLLEGLYLPNIEERCRLWNELGTSLLQFYEGSAMKLIEESEFSAPRLVQLIVQSFPGFRDETVWQGRWVAFYKRAQIAVGDLNAALRLNLKDMDKLTTFADYRVPQILRHWGALEYSTELEKKIDLLEELDVDNEVAVRAATVVCVDELVDEVNSISVRTKMTAVTLDWYLWQVGEKMNGEGKLKPHHRVNTIFY